MIEHHPSITNPLSHLRKLLMAGQPIPPNVPPPRNKAFSRAYQPLVSLSKTFLNELKTLNFFSYEQKTCPFLLGFATVPPQQKYTTFYWLVVEFQPIWKHMIVKLGSSCPSFGVKMKNIWNHHLVFQPPQQLKGPQGLDHHTLSSNTFWVNAVAFYWGGKLIPPT